METRANYALIGLFTLAVVAAAFGFVFWFSGKDAGATLKQYRIIFTGSVSGLQRGGQVLYNGLQVGSVTNLNLLQDDPSKVVALVEIDATTPMNVDTRARLEFTGLTGVASIQLTGGAPGSPPLVSKDPKQPPVILADRSDFQDLLESAQRLAKKADDVLTRADQLFADNAGSISNTVRNIETFSDALAQNSPGIAQFMTSTGNAADKIASLAVDLQKLSDSLDRVVKAIDPAEVSKIVSDVGKVTSSVADQSDKIGDIVRNASELTGRLNDTSVKLDELIGDASAAFKAVDPDKVARVVDGLDKFSTTLGENNQQVAEVIRNANELTAKLNKAGDRIDGVLADAGSALKSLDAALKGVDGTKVARTIDNVDRFTTALGANSDKVDEIVRNAQELSAKLNRSADKVDEVLTSAQNFLGSDKTQGALNSITDMAKSIRVLADNLDKRTAEITAGVSRITGPGLRDFESLTQEGKRTLGDLSRTLRSLERNPQQLIFGAKPSIPEYGGRP
ncbi:MlaD family protein [Alsobacter sp. SYSU M60028]|uniref:MlaD family protein n=1 Tax=Alsobacter ponti TaxID=2962936 RepID=A0ABT1L754_9HYPH|nr:MCE family protein [Alsobacter ponti]MCP8937291.1 MlaD family protein [Alsobacter ponti]